MTLHLTPLFLTYLKRSERNLVVRSAAFLLQVRVLVAVVGLRGGENSLDSQEIDCGCGVVLRGVGGGGG